MNAPIRRITVCAVIGAVAVLGWAATADAAAVSNIRLRHAGDFTEVSIPVPARQLCDHFTQPADPERPFRIVLNLCGVTHALPQKTFSQLPACVVRTIRTSQYALEPEPIVRVVLDLAAPATYTVRTDDDVLTVAISDPQSRAFAEWDAMSPAAPVAAKGAPALAKSATGSAPVTAAPAPATTPAPRKERSFAPDIEEARTPLVVKADDNPLAIVLPSAENSGPEGQVGSPPKAAQPQPRSAPSTIDDLKRRSATAAIVGETTSTVTVNAPAPTPVDALARVPVGLDSTPREMTPATISVPGFPATPDNEANPFVLPVHPLVLAPQYLDEVAAAKPTGTIAEAQATSGAVLPGGATGHSATTVGSAADQAAAAPTSGSQVWASVESPSTGPDVPGTDAAPTTESLIDRLKNKFFSNRPAPRPYTTTEVPISGEEGEAIDPLVQGPPTPRASVDRETLLERIRLASQGATTSATESFEPVTASIRPEVHYNDMGRRDPFEPLLKGVRSGFVSDDLPSVEALRMVGVLRDEQGSMALLEDMEGHSYIMRAGDAVSNGRVLAVGDQRVVFSVDEYGFTRTVVLQLSARGGDPSKSLGAAAPTTEPVPQTVPE